MEKYCADQSKGINIFPTNMKPYKLIPTIQEMIENDRLHESNENLWNFESKITIRTP